MWCILYLNARTQVEKLGELMNSCQEDPGMNRTCLYQPLGNYFTPASNCSQMQNRVQNNPKKTDKRYDLLSCFSSLTEVNYKVVQLLMPVNELVEKLFVFGL